MLSSGITEILSASALLVSTLENMRYPLQLNKKKKI